MPQAEATGLHRRHQARVGIDGNHPREPRKAGGKRRGEGTAGAHEEQLAEYVEWQGRDDEERIYVALVIGPIR